jgi:hypothetical protein
MKDLHIKQHYTLLSPYTHLRMRNVHHELTVIQYHEEHTNSSCPWSESQINETQLEADAVSQVRTVNRLGNVRGS